MSLTSTRHILLLGVDLLILVVGVGHLPGILERSRVPFEAATANDTVRVTRILNMPAAGGLREGDAILRFAGVPVSHHDALEDLGDLLSVGERLTVDAVCDGRPEKADIRMVKYYDSPRFAVVMILVGFIIWFMAVVVASQRLRTAGAHTLHWALVLLALSLLTTQGRVDPANLLSIISRVVLIVSYMVTASLFALFVLVYPQPRVRSIRAAAIAVLSPAAVCAVAVSALYIRLAILRTPAALTEYRLGYDVLHGLQAVYAVAMIWGLVTAYRRATAGEDRTRLQWILWGLIAGPAPFVFAILLPNLFISRDLLPEEVATAFLLIAPFSLAVSLLRHQLFDIEVLINRSIVYTILTVFVGLVYALAILFLASLVGTQFAFEEFVTIVLISLGLAFILNPMRRRLQRVVDDTLFPVRSNARRELVRLSGELHAALTPDDLARLLVSGTMALIPFRSAVLYLRDGDLLSSAYRTGEGMPDAIPLSAVEVAAGSSSETGTLSRLLRAGGGNHRDDLALRLHFSVAIPLRSESGVVLGLFAGIARATGAALAEDEEEFLQSIVATGCEVLERLDLQRSVLVEHQERRRMEELSQIKSAFVSSVSHELRTPLTSIRMFSEMLRSPRPLSRRTRRSYLEIIEHEAERLSRLIDNVLDFSHIERGVKEYHFEPCDVGKIVRRAAAAVAYPFRVNKGTLRVTIPARLPVIEGDVDGLQAAVMNLLSNALKYSTTTRRVDLSVRRTQGRIAIRVSDQGIGIAADQLPRIFDQFYRVRDGRASQVGGMGLGLSLVRHVVEAHHGTIDVQSVVGKGSTFTILLPVSTPIRREA